ncbi:MAG: PQQ-dependent sugar dehydrogenase [Actinomycetota bacterium]
MGIARPRGLRRASCFLALVVLAACGGGGRIQPSPSPSLIAGPLKLDLVGSFSEPIYVASPPSDPRLVVVEKGGTIKVLDENGNKQTFLDISDQVSSGSEQGLFSIAFAPDYATSGLAYVDYTDRQGDSRIVEFKVDPADANRLDPKSRREILFVKQPFANHNGGLLLFDAEGMLVIGFGDGGSSGDPGKRAQNLGQLLGKLLRIDPRRPAGGKPYGIPPDNPFVKKAGARPEIWAYGLRNPWRFSFDQETGDLYVGDVGQNLFEEVSYVPPAKQAGANFGWSKYEGSQIFKRERIDESKLVKPIVTYPLKSGACAVTGGGVYRGSVQALQGFYIYSDFCQGKVQGFRVVNGLRTDEKSFPQLNASSIASFGQDSENEMYVVSLEGKVYKIGTG